MKSSPFRIAVAMLATATALAITACASAPLTASQTLEVSETGAESAYVALATALKSDIAVNPARKVADTAVWNQAWAHLQTVRTLYAGGQSITSEATALVALKVPQ